MKVRVSFSISIDGFGAGPRQSQEDPLGVGGKQLHDWRFNKPTDTDEAISSKCFENVGAWILGRNMFGPIRGAWTDESWKGWWGEEPPFHVPVFVLTHHSRPSFEMKGGTSFHFVTGGIEPALARARDAARGKDVLIGGGAATIRQYLAAGLIDEVHLTVVPVLLGEGEPLLAGMNLLALGYRIHESVATPRAQHVFMKRG